MKSIKILLALLFCIIITMQYCGKNQNTEQQLVALSVDCFNQRYNPDNHDGHKISRIISNRLDKYRKILQHIKMHKRKHIQTTPVIKWAQTNQKIFLNFKLSHRQDSPPCSDVRNQKFNIQNVYQIQAKFSYSQINNQNTNVSKIDFTSQCFFTDQKFMFKLSMTFNSSFKLVTIQREGFGSYTMVGDKKQVGIWIDPFEDVHRAAVWPQMRIRYAAAMDEYFQMREKKLQETQQQKGKKKKKRRTNTIKITQKKQGQEQL